MISMISNLIRVKARMMQIIILIGILSNLSSCTSSEQSQNNSNNDVLVHDSINQHNEKALPIEKSMEEENPSDISNENTKLKLFKENFIIRLSKGEPLNLLFNNNWLIVYHEDNRCDGSTDGQLDSLKSSQIDEVIVLNVKNDGDGWACEKKEPKTFDISFSLKEKVKYWDRFHELENQSEKKFFFIVGQGESDYLKIHYDEFDSNYLIVRLEYRSEDPG